MNQLSEAPQDIAKLLGPGEQVQLYLKQKIYHPKISVDSVVFTNERIILRHPHDINLKKDYTDFSYTDISNALLDKGILRSTIKCVLRFGGDPLTLGKLDNSDAEKAYGIIRANIGRYQTPFSTPGATAAVPAAASMGIKCPKCGQMSNAGSKFCAACGQSFQ